MKRGFIFFSKGLLGSLVVLIIFYLSKTSHYYIAGLVPLFPSFGLIAIIAIFKIRGYGSVRETALFSIFSILPYFFYLFSLYFLIDYFDFYIAVAVSVILWIVISFILIKRWVDILNFINRWGVVR